MKVHAMALSAAIIVSVSGCVASPAPPGIFISNRSSPNICLIMANPTEFADDMLTMNAMIVPNYFDGPLIRSPGCASALGLGRLPQTAECRALEEALGLPGYEPKGDVTATLEGQIEVATGQLPHFRVSACSNVEVGDPPSRSRAVAPKRKGSSSERPRRER